jgi:hypothetical protein
VSVEDVLKIVSVILIPSVGAVVWLLGQVYGLRSDLKEISQILKAEREMNAANLARLEESVAALNKTVHELTMDLARHGLSELKKRT